MARPKKYPNRREVQTDDAIDAMVNDWRSGKPLAYAEAVREMICAAAERNELLKAIER